MSEEKIISQKVVGKAKYSNNIRTPRSRERVQTVNNQKSLTVQADKKQACIHSILSKYQKTGLLPQVQVQPITGEIPDVESFHEAMNTVVSTQQQFDALPSKIRDKFGNDPAQFLAFVKEGKIEDLQELGLVEKELEHEVAKETGTKIQEPVKEVDEKTAS